MNKKYKKSLLCEEGEKILDAIDDIQKQLEVAKESFQNAIDECLIDSYIHEIIALHKKYDYFLKEAKTLGLTAVGSGDNRQIG